MPFLKVLHRTPDVGPATAGFLADLLPAVIAQELSCSDFNGNLKASDVEVDVHPYTVGMRSEYDLQIIVEAKDFPNRRLKLFTAQIAIRAAVHGFFQKNEAKSPKALVCIKLPLMEFAEL